MTTAIADAIKAADRLLPFRVAGASTLTIKGAPFTFRTFPDFEFGAGRDRFARADERTLDRLVTVTLPAIDGEDHKMVPTMEVLL